MSLNVEISLKEAFAHLASKGGVLACACMLSACSGDAEPGNDIGAQQPNATAGAGGTTSSMPLGVSAAGSSTAGGPGGLGTEAAGRGSVSSGSAGAANDTGGASTGGSGPGAGASSGGSGGAGPKSVCSDGLPSSLSDLKHLATDDTTSKQTPLGTRYENVAKHIANTDELAFLSNAAAEPKIPGSTSGLSLKALSVTLYPSSGGVPVPADINQHAIGNCDGDTAFASIAYANPSFIKSLIVDNHDNTFTVAMYDPQGKRISVSVDNRFLVDGGGSIGAVSGKKGVADWATVLEKATMKYIQVWPVVADIGGIGSEHQTPMFTGAGGSIGFDRGKLSKADITRVVKAALAEGKLISGGFGIEGLALASGLETVTAHGYALLVPKDDKIMASMRNPWGLDPTSHGYDASTDGVLDIPPDDKWAGTIDLRVIDPGDACGPGVTKPYQPPASDIQEERIMLQSSHARKAQP